MSTLREETEIEFDQNKRQQQTVPSPLDEYKPADITHSQRN